MKEGRVATTERLSEADPKVEPHLQHHCPPHNPSLSKLLPLGWDPEVQVPFRLGILTSPPAPACLLSTTYLSEGISQFLYSNHICRLRQEFRSH